MNRTEFYQDVLKWVSACKKQHGKDECLFVGISGPQGSGKSTLSKYLVDQLKQQDYKVISLSIDDFYYSYEDQKKLREYSPNPLLHQRGYPGTHELGLATQVLEGLKRGNTLKLPVYDKSAFSGVGDRAASDDWIIINKKQQIVIFEGWFLGFESLSTVNSGDLSVINSLLKNYEKLFSKIDAFLYLKAEDFSSIIDWRIEAEENMKKSGKEGMSLAQVKEYIQKFIPAYELYANKLNVKKYPMYRSYELDRERQAKLL